MLYEIFVKDNVCYCVGRKVADTSIGGVAEMERWTSLTLDSAVKGMIRFAKVANNQKIDKTDITYYRMKKITRKEYTRYKPKLKGIGDV